jgi:hypothetical protein
MNRPTRYTIRVAAHLGDELARWFAPLDVVNEPGGQASIRGALTDQAALHGVLAKIRDLNLTLIAVQRLDEAVEPHPGQ